MSTAQDRVQVLEGHPPLAPGACYLCTSVGGDGRKFIDFARTQKKYGRIYFCSFCFEEVCSGLGWVSPANFDVAELELITLKDEVERLKEENAKLSNLIASSLPGLISDLSTLHTNVSQPKRAVGRPKKAE